MGFTLKTKPSLTAQQSPDAMGLGRTQGQRSAEIMAGIRAELDPTPENIAMTRLMGRIFARIMARMQPDHPGLNYVLIRSPVIQELIKRSRSPENPARVIVELASGYSTLSLHVAQALPQTEVIEIDLPDVVIEKQARLKKGGISVPPNLQWRTADLGMDALNDVLEGKLADVIIAAGVLPYFTHEEVSIIAHRARKNLSDGGVMIADVMWRKPLVEEGDPSTTSFYKRQAGSFLSLVDDEEGARALFEVAGYGDVQCVRPSVVAADLGIDKTVIDYGLMMVARK